MTSPPPTDGPAGPSLEEVIAEASRQLAAAVGPAPATITPPDDRVLTCANHPTVETALRCNRCDKPICIRCAVRTPVGYRCKACVGQQQAVFFTGKPVDYALAGVVSLVLGLIAGLLIAALGSWWFSLILGPVLGGAIAEAVRFVVRKRRSRYLWLATAAGLVVGALPVVLIGLFGLLLLTGVTGRSAQDAPLAIGFDLLAVGLYLGLAVATAVARLK